MPINAGSLKEGPSHEQSRELTALEGLQALGSCRAREPSTPEGPVGPPFCNYRSQKTIPCMPYIVWFLGRIVMALQDRSLSGTSGFTALSSCALE